MSNMERGARLAQLRKRAGLTQLQLAVAIGRDPMAVSRWERGERAMSADDVQACADATGASPGDFFETVSEAPGGEAA